MEFQLTSKFSPTGDQPQAIEQLTQGVLDGVPAQVLLGVTGSGKTFTMANVIVVVARGRAVDATFPELTKAYLGLAKKSGILREEQP